MNFHLLSKEAKGKTVYLKKYGSDEIITAIVDNATSHNAYLEIGEDALTLTTVRYSVDCPNRVMHFNDCYAVSFTKEGLK